MEVKGRLKLKMDKQTFDSGFTKREFVLTTDDAEYPQDIKMELLKDKCDLIEPIEIGTPMTVGINLRGNEYEGKYYVNIVAWRIQTEGDTPKAKAKPQAAPAIAEEEDDDVPF